MISVQVQVVRISVRLQPGDRVHLHLQSNVEGGPNDDDKITCHVKNGNFLHYVQMKSG